MRNRCQLAVPADGLTTVRVSNDVKEIHLFAVELSTGRQHAQLPLNADGVVHCAAHAPADGTNAVLFYMHTRSMALMGRYVMLSLVSTASQSTPTPAEGDDSAWLEYAYSTSIEKRTVIVYDMFADGVALSVSSVSRAYP